MLGRGRGGEGEEGTDDADDAGFLGCFGVFCGGGFGESFGDFGGGHFRHELCGDCVSWVGSWGWRSDLMGRGVGDGMDMLGFFYINILPLDILGFVREGWGPFWRHCLDLAEEVLVWSEDLYLIKTRLWIHSVPLGREEVSSG